MSALLEAPARTDNGHDPINPERVARLRHMLPAEDAIDALVSEGHNETAARKAVEAAEPRTDATGRQVSLVPFSKIEAKRTDWVWTGRVPRGMLSEVIGQEGEGKSALVLSLAAALTRGTLDGDYKDQPCRVALLTTEDDPQRTLRPRLEAAGADLEQVFMVKMKRDGTDHGITFPDDAQAVARALGEAGVKLAIVDPLAGCLDPSVNTWKDTDVRRALTPLLLAAQEHDFAVLGVRHTNKRTNATAREKAMGSVGFLQVVRSALLLGASPDADGLVLAHFKCNVGKTMPSLRVKLDPRQVLVEGRPDSYPVAVLGRETDWCADDIARGAQPEDAKERALSWLLGALRGGPVAPDDLKEQASNAGHAWRTIERAKTDSAGDVMSVREGSGWVWKLSDEAAALTF